MPTNQAKQFHISNMDRAVNFYRQILKNKKYKITPVPESGEKGSEIFYQSSLACIKQTKATIDCDEIEPILDEVSPAGGSVILPKFSLGQSDKVALIEDTEGNTVCLRQN